MDGWRTRLASECIDGRGDAMPQLDGENCSMNFAAAQRCALVDVDHTRRRCLDLRIYIYIYISKVIYIQLLLLHPRAPDDGGSGRSGTFLLAGRPSSWILWLGMGWYGMVWEGPEEKESVFCLWERVDSNTPPPLTPPVVFVCVCLPQTQQQQQQQQW